MLHIEILIKKSMARNINVFSMFHLMIVQLLKLKAWNKIKFKVKI